MNRRVVLAVFAAAMTAGPGGAVVEEQGERGRKGEGQRAFLGEACNSSFKEDDE